MLSLITKKHQYVTSFIAPKINKYGVVRSSSSISLNNNRIALSSNLMKKSMTLLFSTNTDTTEGEIEGKIKLKGDEIRELKSNGLSKEELKPHIDELLSLKDKLASLSPATDAEETKPKKAPKQKNKQKQKQPQGKKKKVEEETDPDKIRLDRIKKLELMKESNINPFEYKYDLSTTSKQLGELYKDKLDPGRHRHGSVSVNGVTWVIGGRDNNDNITQCVDVYEPYFDKWIRLGTFDNAISITSVFKR